MTGLHPEIARITNALRERSRDSRASYLAHLQQMRDADPPRRRLSCGNLAHGYAACSADDKQAIRLMQSVNIGIVTAYNDVLSAHQPLAAYPERIRQLAREAGSTAQVAGGVPAMCDGVTQGQPGMELSLFSRDVIAMATAVSLSHNLFDAVLCLGVCDKIVPGMLIGALQFGHLAVGFIPAGPMASGISNSAKAEIRQRYAAGAASRDELLAAESASYHSPGTCTFYGTANSNQVLMEMLGVQLPGSSFIAPQDPMRDAMIRETVMRVIDAAREPHPLRLADMITASSIVNAAVALLATGGSTNHTLHLVAIARAAGIQLGWNDLDALSRVVPLLMRVYPNGSEDINAFQRAGGMAYLCGQLRAGGLLNEDVVSLMGPGLDYLEYAPRLASGENVLWDVPVGDSGDLTVLRPPGDPFSAEGGLRLLAGNLGSSIIKLSAVKAEHQKIRAPCAIFHDQAGMKAAFERGELDRDVVVVIRFQGPRANGMPELHQLTPYLGVLQDRGYRVALVTDGRMSGASGKVPAAIHVCPEALDGGAIARLRNGDIIELDANTGTLNVSAADADFAMRAPATHEQAQDTLGRGLFRCFRDQVSKADAGACVFAFNYQHGAGPQE